uniref:Superoxide dismutase [Cu-Zn] n=1 Tax=Arcella intermedia TaxID=1963864 RepID=A0A6B2LNB5_9EUKA
MEGEIRGKIHFDQESPEEPVLITGEVLGLRPGKHGFHIHEFGDLGNGCLSTGMHFNPFKKPHAGPSSSERHLGDLGNIETDGEGITKFHIEDKMITLFGINSIVGRAVVIHQDEDDLGLGGHEDSKTTGHAGSRLACGIIALTAPAQ